MATLLERLEARLSNPELTANFNREVSRLHEVTAEDKRNYAMSHEAYLRYTSEYKP